MPLSTTDIAMQKRRIVMRAAMLLIISILFAGLSYQRLYDGKLDELKNIQGQKLFIAANLFSRELGGLGDLLSLLANGQALYHENTQKDKNNQTQDLSLKVQQQVQNYFIQFGKASPRIAQIRWLNQNGQEVIRVDFKAGQAKVSRVNRLQNKQSRYYFKQGMKVAAPKRYFSPIDLNVEHGAVVQPFEPTIRGTIQTSSSTHLLQGLIIVNYQLDHLLTTIRDHSIPEAQLSIVNHDGFWLLNSQPDKEWGFMLNQPKLSLKTASQELWLYQSQHAAGGDYIVDNVLSSFIPLATFVGSGSGATTNKLILYATSSKKYLSLAQKNSLYFALVIFLTLVLCGSIIMWRGYRYQDKLIELSLKLHDEHQRLEQANASLIENIARQQLLQDELVEANKLSSLGLMVAGVAHELNTPIGGAIICVTNADNANDKLKKAMEQGLSKSQFSAAVNLINRSLHLAIINLDKAVSHIKHFKRLAIDRVNEDYLNCLLDDIVSDLIISLRPLLKKGKVVVIEDVEDNLILVSRPGIISQVLENLVVNSLNHGFESGQQGIIKIKARRLDTNQICITVSDNGSGIPSSMQSNLFEPFVTSGRGKGNIGLGLYMVNQWVTKLLAGKLSFVSEENSNREFTTQFTVLLPINSNVSKINKN
jgi:signal transduction histidine kinase